MISTSHRGCRRFRHHGRLAVLGLRWNHDAFLGEPLGRGGNGANGWSGGALGRKNLGANGCLRANGGAYGWSGSGGLPLERANDERANGAIPLGRSLERANGERVNGAIPLGRSNGAYGGSANGLSGALGANGWNGGARDARDVAPRDVLLRGNDDGVNGKRWLRGKKLGTTGMRNRGHEKRGCCRWKGWTRGMTGISWRGWTNWTGWKNVSPDHGGRD